MKALIINGSSILLKSEAGIRTLLSRLEKEQEMLKQKEIYEQKKDKGPWGLEELASLFKGFTEEEINKKAREIVEENLREEARETIEKIKEKGFFVVCYSSELINILEVLKEKLGLDEIYGNILEFENGICTGRLQKKVDRYGRVKKIEEFIQKNNLAKKDTFIIGDSVTALPSAQLGRVISFNSKSPELESVSEFKISRFSELIGVLAKMLLLNLFFVYLHLAPIHA